MNEMWAHLALGPLLLPVAIWFVIFPPADINWLYGYRTRRSMASQEAWDFANHFSARLLIWVSIATIGCQLGSIFLFESLVSISVSAGVMITLLLVTISFVESKLKERFS